MKKEYIEKIYAGWLAKIIGIRLGAPIEGWTYEKIKNVYGEIHNYPVDYKRFAADDDWNGPIFFVRALEDGSGGLNLTPTAVAEALLNYAPFEHGFFWWGGYGVSTEHTAYLNLRSGIPAPRSGSIQQNGHMMAEQIGGQIFIDSWGLVNPGNTDRAAKMAEMAASVTHDGNGIYGGIFVAVCISHAFVESNLRKVIEKGLSYIPADCEYARVVREVMAFYDKDESKEWRDCYRYIHANFGYDKYPGNCHIIPNIGVMILALLYGEGDFDDTVNICNMCGWDTDCNVGNVATIMGVICGLEQINDEKWRKPINDVIVCSSVVGSLNIMDIPYGAAYMVKLAYALVDEEPPQLWQTILQERIDSCHFEFPGSTHGIEVVRGDGKPCKVRMINSTEQAATGLHSLKISVLAMGAGERVYVYKRTHLSAEEFDNNRYEPSFSPLVYPGQEVKGSVFIPDYGTSCTVKLFVKNGETEEIIEGESILVEKGQWEQLSFRIPFIPGGRIDEAGFAFDVHGTVSDSVELVCFVDDLHFTGSPNYTIDFSLVKEDFWHVLQREITQFTKLKGHAFLENDRLYLSCSDFAEMYTGRYDWKDYTATFVIQPQLGKEHFVNVRVQGAIRSYGIGFSKDKCSLKKNENGYRTLAEVDFPWEAKREYSITVVAKGNQLKVSVDGSNILEVVDNHKPYLTGGIGVSVFEGSCCGYRSIEIR